MRPTRIEGADPKPLGAPSDWKPDENGHCSALFVRRERIDNLDYMRSAWEVESGEATRLFAGARLTLGIAGDCHPVVQLGTTELPEEFEPVVTARRLTAADGAPMVRVEMLYPANKGAAAYAVVPVETSLGAAISRGVDLIEGLAREKGWA